MYQSSCQSAAVSSGLTGLLWQTVERQHKGCNPLTHCIIVLLKALQVTGSSPSLTPTPVSSRVFLWTLSLRNESLLVAAVQSFPPLWIETSPLKTSTTDGLKGDLLRGLTAAVAIQICWRLECNQRGCTLDSRSEGVYLGSAESWGLEWLWAPFCWGQKKCFSGCPAFWNIVKSVKIKTWFKKEQNQHSSVQCICTGQKTQNTQIPFVLEWRWSRKKNKTGVLFLLMSTI